jgi:hypothetical protein
MHYRRIWEKAHGPIPVDEQGRSYEIHHLDGNRKNNSLLNLTCVSIEEHYSIHESQGDGAACHAIKLRMTQEPLIGWNHTQESRDKMSKSRKGKKPSTQTKEKLRLARLGKKHSNKTKKAISKALKGKQKTQDHIEKNRIGHLGLKQTKKTVEKRKETIKNQGGYKHSEEIKLKMRKPKSQEHLQKMKMPRKLVVCPHCGKVGGSCAMKRWHFSNCRNIVFKKVG